MVLNLMEYHQYPQQILEASNGVVHVVDKVIGLPTIVDFAVSNPNLVHWSLL